MADFTIEPLGGWHEGDAAYCVRGSMDCSPPLIAGKIYEVEAVKSWRGMQQSGLSIKGVSIPERFNGFTSSRFVKVVRRGGVLRQITAYTARSLHASYIASGKNRQAQPYPCDHPRASNADAHQLAGAGDSVFHDTEVPHAR